MIDKIAAAFLLLASQGASEPGQCLPRQAAGQMAAVLLPSAIEALGARCAAHLPASGFLATGGNAMAQRLRTETAAFRDRAMEGILEFAGQPGVIAPGQNPELMLALVTGSMIPELDAATCRSASELLEALSPLPADNIVRMSAALISVYAAHHAEDGAPAICPE